MTSILSRTHAGELLRFARGHVLLAFDFDGTLAPIVANRDEARMRPSTEGAFARLCRAYPCAVLSGRSVDDVRARLGDAPVRYVVGNHGMEPGTDLDTYERITREGLGPLREALSGMHGVEVEDKRYSLAVHYRAARRRRHARASILRAVGALGERPRIVAGKQVLNLVPREAPHKGDALLGLMSLERAERAIYVGDDVTDEDVFRLDRPDSVLGIRVGRSRSSAARFHLRAQADVDRLIERLLALRP